MLCTAKEPHHGCNDHKLASLKQRWKYLLAQKSASEKLYLYQAVRNDIAKYSQYVAQLLRSVPTSLIAFHLTLFFI